MGDNQIVGTWRLMSYTCADKNGKIDYPLGPNTRGYIMYTADGYMSVSMSAGDRPNRASDDLVGGTDEEKITEAETFYSPVGRLIGTYLPLTACPRRESIPTVT